ncbi:2-amino-4-hydroxy-6-hydroxymethyldihydropteridine diphosphokinase [Candidatus Saganbacteria bacterium]|nr:2-amino-4-hydroxy-6-hydroxymethyldihydropteridine diphosphokinase [Candidatus Saganbacteria bacterium]
MTVYLSLGSNVGDREEYIEQANFLLEKNPRIQVVKHSSNIETEAEGGANQPPFINSAVMIKTSLPPHQLLDVCQEIETTLGRERELEWGPRTIDIDILLYGDEIVSDEKLQIPHPLLHERMFVLRPLREIAPNALHPIMEKTIEALYEERKTEAGEKYDDELPGFKEIKGGGYDDYEKW